MIARRGAGVIVLLVAAGLALSSCSQGGGDIGSVPGEDGDSPLAVSDGDHAVIMFVTTACPVSNAYQPAWRKLESDFAGRGFHFRLVSVGDESPAAIASWKSEFDVRSPVHRDTGRDTARSLGARRTAQVFVVDDRARVRYSGRVDDRWASRTQKRRVTRHDLREALRALASGGTPDVAETESFG